MTRVIAYLRQSEARPGEGKETSLSLDGQEARALAWCEANSATLILPSIRDHDRKGDDPNRPGIQLLLQRIETDRPDLVWLFMLSRFARDEAWQEITWQRIRKLGPRVVSDREPGVEHRIVRGMLGLVNEMAKDERSAFARMAFAQRAHRGLANGTPAFGYRKVDKQLVPDPDESPIVLLIYGWAAEGKTTWQIAEALDALGLRPRRAIRWRPGQVRDVLVNPVYRGAVALNGEVVMEDAHPAIICPELWHRVQEQRRRWPVVRRKRDPHWIEGLITHGCGERMYRFVTKAGAVKEYPYFACKSVMAGRERKCDVSPSTITAKKLERAVRRVLWADLRAQASVSLAEAMERGTWLAGGETAQRARAKLDQQRRAAMARRVNIQDGVEYGVYAAADAAERLAVVDADLREIANDLAALPAAPTETDYRQAMDLMADWAEAAPAMDSDDLRVIIAAAGGIVYGADGVRIAWAGAFAARVTKPVVLRP